MTDNKTREEIQAELRAQAKKTERKQLFKRIGIWAAVIVGLAALVWGLALLASNPNNNPDAGTLQDPVTASDWQKGDPNSKVVLVEYSDFQCPFCRNYEPYLKNILQKYGNKILYVYRNYPLTQAHVHAQIAAQAAEAAGKQGKFWEMHDVLFNKQNDWGENDNAEQLIRGYAQSLGLDMNKYDADFNSQEVKNDIAADVASGDRANVQATPTFYLNGNKLNLNTYEDLDTAISNALK